MMSPSESQVWSFPLLTNLANYSRARACDVSLSAFDAVSQRGPQLRLMGSPWWVALLGCPPAAVRAEPGQCSSTAAAMK
eukprot:7427033-Pyramimonas_sp.AAC.1